MNILHGMAIFWLGLTRGLKDAVGANGLPSLTEEPAIQQMRRAELNAKGMAKVIAAHARAATKSGEASRNGELARLQSFLIRHQ